MRQIKFLTPILLFLLAGCASEIHQKIKLDIPAYSPINIQEFQQIILIPFIISSGTPEAASIPAAENVAEKEKKNEEEKEKKKEEEKQLAAAPKKIEPALDVQAEMIKYFATELGRKFKGQVRLEARPLPSAELIHKPEYWQSLSPDSRASLIFTGQASFKEEIRKAILYRSDLYRADQSEEDLFGPEKKLASRHVFTLELNLALIKPETGEVLLERNFKETKITPDLKYPARFALYELLQRVKLILFRQIFGEERPQERYLLLK
jgi:hypothetical protein